MCTHWKNVNLWGGVAGTYQKQNCSGRHIGCRTCKLTTPLFTQTQQVSLVHERQQQTRLRIHRNSNLVNYSREHFMPQQCECTGDQALRTRPTPESIIHPDLVVHLQ
ncbi:unnamed protein product [Ectocarpus sp. 4 AP-2014]